MAAIISFFAKAAEVAVAITKHIPVIVEGVIAVVDGVKDVIDSINPLDEANYRANEQKVIHITDKVNRYISAFRLGDPIRYPDPFGLGNQGNLFVDDGTAVFNAASIEQWIVEIRNKCQRIQKKLDLLNEGLLDLSLMNIRELDELQLIETVSDMVSFDIAEKSDLFVATPESKAVFDRVVSMSNVLVESGVFEDSLNFDSNLAVFDADKKVSCDAPGLFLREGVKLLVNDGLEAILSLAPNSLIAPAGSAVVAAPVPWEMGRDGEYFGFRVVMDNSVWIHSVIGGTDMDTSPITINPVAAVPTVSIPGIATELLHEYHTDEVEDMLLEVLTNGQKPGLLQFVGVRQSDDGESEVLAAMPKDSQYNWVHNVELDFNIDGLINGGILGRVHVFAWQHDTDNMEETKILRAKSMPIHAGGFQRMNLDIPIEGSTGAGPTNHYISAVFSVEPSVAGQDQAAMNGRTVIIGVVGSHVTGIKNQAGAAWNAITLREVIAKGTDGSVVFSDYKDLSAFGRGSAKWLSLYGKAYVSEFDDPNLSVAKLYLNSIGSVRLAALSKMITLLRIMQRDRPSLAVPTQAAFAALGYGRLDEMYYAMGIQPGPDLTAQGVTPLSWLGQTSTWIDCDGPFYGLTEDQISRVLLQLTAHLMIIANTAPFSKSGRKIIATLTGGLKV